jgi:cobalt-zinc-cadmium efflux system protein
VVANAVLLLGVAIYVIIEAIERMRDPGDIDSALMIVVALSGMIVNLISFSLLREGARSL